ncbi:hypothetical protein B0H14DRAFT_3493508 [Mycena olivaceomarginata]|nr:hypothetical protein B0H14DRAFT_3493508 [Mycena olivaceomarginata]
MPLCAPGSTSRARLARLSPPVRTPMALAPAQRTCTARTRLDRSVFQIHACASPRRCRIARRQSSGYRPCPSDSEPVAHFVNAPHLQDGFLLLTHACLFRSVPPVPSQHARARLTCPTWGVYATTGRLRAWTALCACPGISYVCANGEVAPFVGHNVFLRWSAVQGAAFDDPDHGKRKQWREQRRFKEGASLTLVDELARWQKHAYGCDEIIFNPALQDQDDVLHVLVLSVHIRFYLHSFEILLACTVVFPGLGNLGFTLLEYRLGHHNFFAALVENLRWVPFFLFFFSGLSIHLSTTILAHLFSYDMTWGSMVKEVEWSTFWIEGAPPHLAALQAVVHHLLHMVIVMMIVMQSDAVLFEWQIPGWNWALNILLSLVVGTHVLLPVGLAALPELALRY